MQKKTFYPRLTTFLFFILVAATLLFPFAAKADDSTANSADIAPYADDADMDYIPDYLVTVDLRADGWSAPAMALL